MFLLWLCASVLIISISVIQNYLSKLVLRHFIFWGYYITARSTACLLHLQYLNWWHLYNVHVINVLLIIHMTSLYCFSIDDQERMSIFSTIWQFSDVALGTISPRSLLWKHVRKTCWCCRGNEESGAWRVQQARYITGSLSRIGHLKFVGMSPLHCLRI